MIKKIIITIVAYSLISILLGFTIEIIFRPDPHSSLQAIKLILLLPANIVFFAIAWVSVLLGGRGLE